MNANPIFSLPRCVAGRLCWPASIGLGLFFLLANLASAGAWRFAVIGDTRGDSDNTPATPWVNTPALAAMAAAITNDQAELVLVTGDLIYGTLGTNLAAQFAVWTNAFAPVYTAGIPVY
ncbi:MAG: hypothetical protein HYV36_03765, partial [Lentisphaerae bacterium]|nr:hypothetical protein [Lentisphaerota bacterium]